MTDTTLREKIRQAIEAKGVEVGNDVLIENAVDEIVHALHEAVEGMKKNYIYQNSKTEWCDGYDAALSDVQSLLTGGEKELV